MQIRTVEIFLQLFLVIPLLIYMGIAILVEKQPKNVMFYVFLIGCFLLVIFVHIHRIYDLAVQIRHRQPLSKEVGVLILALALFLLFVNVRAIKN